MIKKIIFWGFIFLLPLVSFAQQPKKQRAYIKFGTGLYWDIGMAPYINNFKDPVTELTPKPVVRGQDIWFEGGIRLNDGLIFSAKMLYVPLKRKYLDMVYQGQEYNYNIKNFTINLGYESLAKAIKLCRK